MTAPFSPALSRAVGKRFDSPIGFDGFNPLLNGTYSLGEGELPIELALFANIRRCSVSTVVAGVAAQQSCVSLIPPNSGDVLVVCERIRVASNIADGRIVAFNDAVGISSAVTERSLDRRATGSPAAMVEKGTAPTIVVASADAMFSWIDSGTRQLMDLFDPRGLWCSRSQAMDRLCVATEDNNSTLYVEFHWREVPLEKSETVP